MEPQVFAWWVIRVALPPAPTSGAGGGVRTGVVAGRAGRQRPRRRRRRAPDPGLAAPRRSARPGSIDHAAHRALAAAETLKW